MPSPTSTEIRQARKQAGLTQSQAAELIHASAAGWRKWESGAREMHAAFWELFLIKSKTPDVFGLWKHRNIDGLTYQEQTRSEW